MNIEIPICQPLHCFYNAQIHEKKKDLLSDDEKKQVTNIRTELSKAFSQEGLRLKYFYCTFKNDNFYYFHIRDETGQYNCWRSYVTNKYFIEHTEIYDSLRKIMNYIPQTYTSFFIQDPYSYVNNNSNFLSVSQMIKDKQFTYTKLLKNKLIDENKSWTETNFDKIELNFNIDMFAPQSFGTFIDKVLKYGIDKSEDPYAYFNSCNIYIDDIFNNVDEFIGKCIIYDKCLEYIKNAFVGLKSGKNILNTCLQIYGEPDLISDEYMIEIKTGANILQHKYYLQLLFFCLMFDKHKIAIIDPINGKIYTKCLDLQKMKRLKEYIRAMSNKQ